MITCIECNRSYDDPADTVTLNSYHTSLYGPDPITKICKWCSKYSNCLVIEPIKTESMPDLQSKVENLTTRVKKLELKKKKKEQGTKNVKKNRS